MNRRRLLILLSIVTVALIFPQPGETHKSTIDIRSYKAQGVVWNVRTNKKVIALTFDDGPNPLYTTQILDLLKQYHANATFFVTGMQVQRNPKLAKRQVQEGHELGNHTYNHPKMSRLTKVQIQQELSRTNQAILSATGQQPPLLFRPPGGYIDQAMVNAAKEVGYSVVLWSFHQDTQDWKRPGVRKIVKKVVNHARAGDIVLFHDHGGNRSQTVKALKQILPALQKKGYRFVTVSDLMMEENVKDIYDIHFMEGREPLTLSLARTQSVLFRRSRGMMG
ncbi:polysaccharide deacetylase family protein [Brevibacillus ruminantium]|uniref:Polysaccharide deacetylase family protein n=1 Tax=Brevibacillus ruminantium TaxID=2950604 RepID=A0ABY4WMB5_9BACL|nr:polysaccharide deacetylase family protein [Brevibacillus ruminantium]USG67906.1 polysaccharide deacetylase family protein [Brevibacillus ruminantium]